jgi:arylsulfatase A-like enzyme
MQLPDNWFHRQKVFSNDLFTERALKFLDEGAADPFFLYLPYTIPHANNELGQMQPNGMEVPDQGVYAKENWPEVEKNFAAAITRMDRDIGRILALLEKKGTLDNTLIFFTSDNGAHKEGGHDPKFFGSSGPLRGTKRDLYEGGTRVPAIARWKGRIAPGSESDFTWAFWDVLPTLAEVAGVAAPSGVDGMSILPALMGKSQAPHEYLYWEFHERGFHQAVRQGQWKLVRQGPKFQTELFDLSKDLSEQDDVAGKHADIVKRMGDLFRSARTESPHWPVKIPG